MAALIGAIALVVGFYRDLGDVFRDRQTRMALVWVVILLIVGTAFYALVEGWTLIDAFYFSVVTLTTVGYGDFSPTTTAGKLFTTIYIFWGLSIVVAFANAIARKRFIRRGRAGDASVDASVDASADAALEEGRA